MWFALQSKPSVFTVADFDNSSKVEIFEVCKISEIFKNHRYFKNQENLENPDNLKNFENLPNCSNLLEFEKFRKSATAALFGSESQVSLPWPILKILQKLRCLRCSKSLEMLKNTDFSPKVEMYEVFKISLNSKNHR